jgi:hypothetical protein
MDEYGGIQEKVVVKEKINAHCELQGIRYGYKRRYGDLDSCYGKEKTGSGHSGWNTFAED